MEFEKLLIPCLELTNGHYLKDFYIDPTTPAPPGFIALRKDNYGIDCTGCMCDYPVVPCIEFVRVSSIASFTVPEGSEGLLWHQFDYIPETVQVRSH